MDINSTLLKNTIYELMNGNYNLVDLSLKGANIIENEFENGSYCEKLYEQVYASKCNLMKKLETETEDEDLESIIDSMFKICEYLCYKMYDYGVFFSAHPNR